ncbi:MAG: substrate-binding domain-containing protein [Selenomonadaceae bacterium]|nr:substrate-binding domain-containing protein [Selenomonadaceae bacterium]
MKVINFLKGMILVTLMIILSGFSSEPDIAVIENTARADKIKPTAAANQYKIYLITMDLADDFWKSIDLGCRKAVSELGGIDYKWIGPDVNEDLPQRRCIEQAVDEGADAILLAASSPRGVNESLEKAAQAGVKIIYVDNAAQFDFVAFLATDNELAGMIAGETMKTALIEARITSGTIGLMVNKDNVTSTALRVKGFRKVFEGSNFTLADTFFMEDDPQRIKTFVKDHPDYIAFFGSNERTALALGQQIKDSASKQIVIGFDTSDEVLTLLYDGAIYATIQQKPDVMGYDGIRIALDALKGNYTETNAVIDTGVKIIYKDSI